MNFEEFCKYIKEHIREYLPEELQDHVVVMKDVQKINYGKLRSIMLLPPGGAGGLVQYLEPYFEAYENGIPLEGILSRIVKCHMENRNMEQELPAGLRNFHEVKDRIVTWAAGYSKNSEILEKIPHRVMGDIAATYRICIGKDDGVMMSCVITNELMDHYGLDTAQLHELAVQNSMKAMPAESFTMRQLLEDLEVTYPEDILPDTGMIIVTNKQKNCGASVVFYPEIFEKIGLPMERYYVIPSSVHEILLMPKRMKTYEEMNEMIKEVNESCCAENEVLSNLVHEYDPVSKQLVLGGSLQRERKEEKPEVSRDDRGKCM